MVKNIEQIRNVNLLISESNEILYKIDDKLTIVSKRLNKEIVLENIYCCYINSPYLYYQHKNLEPLYRLNLDSLDNKKIEGLFSLVGGFNIGRNIYVLGKEEGQKVVYIINKEGFTVKKVVPYTIFPSILIDSYCIKERKQEIKCYDDCLEQCIWSYTCPEGRKIEGKLYEYEGVLAFIEIDDNVQTTLVGLDIDTGDILYKVEVGLIHYQQQDNTLYGFASNSFGDNTYSEIDIVKGEVYEKSFSNYKKNVVSHLATIKDNYLYYSIYKQGSIGVIDVTQREIIKEETLDIKEGVEIHAPLVTEDKIYILDSENVLHIYERADIL